MSITTADRAGALRVARPRSFRQYRDTGTYPVTVGGYAVGQVRKDEAGLWRAYAEEGTRVGRDGAVDDAQAFSTRKAAVAALAHTDFAAKAYRESAREGVHGTAEERRVRDEDTAALVALDAELEETPAPTQEEQDALVELARAAGFSAGTDLIRGQRGVAVYAPGEFFLTKLRLLAADHGQEVVETEAPSIYLLGPTRPARSPEGSGFEVHELLDGIRSIDARPGDVITVLGQEVLEEPFPVVAEPARHVHGPDRGPIGVRLRGSRSMVTYLYVDQHPKISVRRPAN